VRRPPVWLIRLVGWLPLSVVVIAVFVIGSLSSGK
jgi:hypothetical protein